MGSLFTTPELFAEYVKVAHDYRLPFLVVKVSGERAKLLSLLSPADIVLDAVVIASPDVRPDQTVNFYLDAIKNLQSGLTEMIVHLGHDDAELQAITVDHEAFGAAWRQRDFDAVNSPQFKQALKDNNIILVKWSDLQKLVYPN
jgi:YdjC-like protein